MNKVEEMQIPEELKQEFKSAIDESIKNNIEPLVGKAVAEKAQDIVRELRAQRALFGGDVSGLTSERKVEIMGDIRDFVLHQKAPMTSDSDSAGGYLIPTDVHEGIMRIAATSGYVARDAMKMPLVGNKSVPRYTSSELLGSYIGKNQEADETTVTLGDARLVPETWVVLMRAGNSLLQAASVDVFDWLIGLFAEGLSARLDKEGFIGGTYAGSPFVGILGSDDVTVLTLNTNDDSFADFDGDYASEAIGNIKDSILSDSAFFFHRTVWAEIRKQKDGNGRYVFGQNGGQVASSQARKTGLQAVGDMWGFPVYVTDYLPAFSADAASTKFGFFANLSKALVWGETEPLRIARSESATINGVNTFAANQTGIRGTHDHAIAMMLPEAAVVFKTAS